MINVFRTQYRGLNAAENDLLRRIKDKAGELYELYGEAAMAQTRVWMPSEMGRQVALARTKLEESVMWGVKAVTG